MYSRHEAKPQHESKMKMSLPLLLGSFAMLKGLLPSRCLELHDLEADVLSEAAP